MKFPEPDIWHLPDISLDFWPNSLQHQISFQRAPENTRLGNQSKIFLILNPAVIQVCPEIIQVKQMWQDENKVFHTLNNFTEYFRTCTYCTCTQDLGGISKYTGPIEIVQAI